MNPFGITSPLFFSFLVGLHEAVVTSILALAVLSSATSIAHAQSTVAAGEYFIVSQLNDAAVADTAQAVPQTQLLDAQNPHQIWVITAQGQGKFTLLNKATGRFLNALQDNELRSSKTKGVFEILPFQSALKIRKGRNALAIHGGHSRPNTPMIFWENEAVLHNQWQFIPATQASLTSLAVNAGSQPTFADNQLDNSTKKYRIYPNVSGGYEGFRMLRNQPFDMNPAGLYVKRGDKIALRVSDIPIASKGTPQNLELYIGEHNAFWDTPPNKNPHITPLKAGDNTVVAKRDGLLYFRYIRRAWDAPQNTPATIVFQEGGRLSPLYQHGKTSDSDWAAALQQTQGNSPWVQVLSDKALVTVKRSSFNPLTAQVQPQKTIPRLHRVLDLSNQLAGFDGSKPVHQPTPLRTHFIEDNNESGGYYMFATDHIIGLMSDSIGDVLIDERLAKNWGPWHEVGHLFQNEDWTWSSVGEVTVNINSLFIQEQFGQPSRLLAKDLDGALSDLSRLQVAQRYLANPKHRFADENDEVSSVAALFPFEQLRRYYGKDFYPKLQRHYRENPIDYKWIADDNYKVQHFIRVASKVAGHNLAPFFTHWRLKPSPETLRNIEQLPLPPKPVEQTIFLF